jgi:hypothetical protein
LPATSITKLAGSFRLALSKIMGARVRDIVTLLIAWMTVGGNAAKVAKANPSKHCALNKVGIGNTSLSQLNYAPLRPYSKTICQTFTEQSP